MFLENLLDPIFSPLLSIPSFVAVVLVSFVISLIITVIYKYTTDQNLMKQLKEEMKAFQKQVKELKKEPEKAMAVQRKAMQTNMKYMMQSMKSTLYSFLPIILIFGWMNANFAFVPLQPGDEFVNTINFEEGISGDVEISVPPSLEVSGSLNKEIEFNQAKWELEGDAGEYLIEYSIDGKKYSHQVLVDELQYFDPVKKINDGVVKTIAIDMEKRVVMNLGFWKPGWLATYIIFAIIFSMVIRKLMKVY